MNGNAQRNAVLKHVDGMMRDSLDRQRQYQNAANTAGGDSVRMRHLGVAFDVFAVGTALVLRTVRPCRSFDVPLLVCSGLCHALLSEKQHEHMYRRARLRAMGNRYSAFHDDVFRSRKAIREGPMDEAQRIFQELHAKSLDLDGDAASSAITRLALE